MSFKFEFKGGVAKPGVHDNEKFLLFFVVGGAEVPLFQMVQMGLCQQISPTEFSTATNVCKLFMFSSGFGKPKVFHSFYLRLLEGPHPVVKFNTFSKNELPEFHFKAKCQQIPEREAVQLLDETNPSRKFVLRQTPLPKKTMESIMEVDKSALREGVRHVRIGKRNGKGKEVVE